MNKMYVPILKCKKGEQTALLNLTEDVADKTIPLLEIPFAEPKKRKDLTKLIESFWPDKNYFIYFMSKWYNNIPDKLPELIDSEIIPIINNTQYAIPTFDLSMLSVISDFNILSQNGIAIRVRNNEFEQIESTLNPLFDNNILDRHHTDLIFDLEHVPEKDIYTKKVLLDKSFSVLKSANEFHSIIIASTSFPKILSGLESEKIHRFKRTEPDIFAHASSLKEQYGFTYCYSDYGTTDNENTEFIPGMIPNFKIKYTSSEHYLCIIGVSLKKGGLDIGNVQRLSKLLTDSPEYSGQDYSWGDEKIYMLAQKRFLSPGNLTTWVGYSMNHHITFIVQHL